MLIDMLNELLKRNYNYQLTYDMHKSRGIYMKIKKSKFT